jgi:uncharacterized ferritin-like protein (DUF455 family)
MSTTTTGSASRRTKRGISRCSRAGSAKLGHAYGDFDAHNGLWDMAQKTAGSCLERMALVPRVLEARGLDVTPGMIERLERAGDSTTADILRVILPRGGRARRVRLALVPALLRARGRSRPVGRFRELVERAGVQSLRGPINREARLRAGFTGEELDALPS